MQYIVCKVDLDAKRSFSVNDFNQRKERPSDDLD